MVLTRSGYTGEGGGGRGGGRGTQTLRPAGQKIDFLKSRDWYKNCVFHFHFLCGG